LVTCGCCASAIKAVVFQLLLWHVFCFMCICMMSLPLDSETVTVRVSLMLCFGDSPSGISCRFGFLVVRHSVLSCMHVLYFPSRVESGATWSSLTRRKYSGISPYHMGLVFTRGSRCVGRLLLLLSPTQWVWVRPQTLIQCGKLSFCGAERIIYFLPLSFRVRSVIIPCSYQHV
jgi:hypothetical protein